MSHPCPRSRTPLRRDQGNLDHLHVDVLDSGVELRDLLRPQVPRGSVDGTESDRKRPLWALRTLSRSPRPIEMSTGRRAGTPGDVELVLPPPLPHAARAAEIVMKEAGT